MKISIITISYNSSKTIEETIRSVINQSYSNIEYIIIDGGSTDATLEITNRYKSQISKLVSEKDEGLYYALNKGIALCTGDIIGIIHSDDFYTNSYVIEKIVDVFTKEKCEALYANLYYVNKNNTDKIVRKWKSGIYKTGYFLKGWMPPHPTFFVKADCYKKLGNFNTEFKTSADYELMLRFIHKHNIKLSYLDEFIVKMRMGGQSNSNTKNRIEANKEDKKAWEVNNLKPRFYTLFLKPIRKIMQFL